MHRTPPHGTHVLNTQARSCDRRGRSQTGDDEVGTRGVPGFVNYAAVRSGEGGVTVTVCEEKAGTDESSRRAAEWVKENVSATGNPPAMTEGTTVLQFSS
jgi:hypothetical protein